MTISGSGATRSVHCGGTGHDISEQLDVEPARYFVRVIKREKCVCRSCEQNPVVMAPLGERIVEKGLASDRVVIETVVGSTVITCRCTGRQRCWSGKRD